MIHELKVLSGRDGPAATATPRAPSDVPDGFGRDHDPDRAAAATLTDGFGRQHTYLRLSLVERCNLRCRYCMPEDGLDWTPDAQLLTDAEILRLVRLFVGEGVTKIRLTGGEPLLRPGIETLAAEIGQMEGVETLALTTNGLLLPKKIDALQSAGVNRLNLSLDTLRPERFRAITRREGFGPRDARHRPGHRRRLRSAQGQLCRHARHERRRAGRLRGVDERQAR